MKTSTNHLPIDTNKFKRSLLQVCTGVAAGLCLSLLAASEAVAASFSFTKIADTRNDFTLLLNSAAINDSGTVAFIASSETKRGVYTSSGDQITEIASAQQGLLSVPPLVFDAGAIFRTPIFINNKGTVALPILFTRIGPVPVNEVSFSIIQDGTFTNRARIPFRSGQPIDSFLDYALNDQDELVYLIRNPTRIFLTKTNQPELTIPTRIDVNVTDVAINNSSEVIFAEDRPVSGTRRIVAVNGNTETTLAEINASAIDVNDNGDVVLSNQDAIRVLNRASGTLRAIADTSGQFTTFSSSAINNNGDVAFVASLDMGGTGIFTGADSITDKVIATGDTLFGSTVTNLNFLPQGFNNNSQIAFFAQLADGTQGIFRADLISESPKSVPEGTSVLGLVSVALLLFNSRRQSLRSKSKVKSQNYYPHIKVWAAVVRTQFFCILPLPPACGGLGGEKHFFCELLKFR